MDDLCKAVIKLAYEQPKLRPKLLPLVKEAVRLDPDQERMFDALKLIAENEGRFYKNRDAKGAVEFAWKEHQKNVARAMRDDFRVVKGVVIKALEDYWRTEDELAGI